MSIYHMVEHRRKFQSAIKAGAVQMVIETGKPIAEVARDLGAHDGEKMASAQKADIQCRRPRTYDTLVVGGMDRA